VKRGEEAFEILALLNLPGKGTGEHRGKPHARIDEGGQG